MSKIKDEAEMQVSKLREDLLKEGGQLLPPANAGVTRELPMLTQTAPEEITTLLH